MCTIIIIIKCISRLIDSKQISTLTAQVLELQDQVKTAKATEKKLEAQVESLKEVGFHYSV